MSTFGHQLKLLLWKNFLLRKRHLVRMVIEFLWPLVLFLILMWVRTRGLKENKTACHHVPKVLPSVGGFEFFQNFLCTLSNPCFEKYVEEEKDVWGGAQINKIVTAATPVLQGLVANNRTLATVNQVWRSVNVFAILAGGLQSKSEIKRLGPSKVKDFMTPEGKKGFVDTAEVYTGLSKSILEKALESEVYLDAINSDSLRVLIDDLQNGKCGPGKDYEIFKPSSSQSYEEICKLGPQKAFLLLYIFSLYMDRDGLARKVQSGMSYDKLMSEPNELSSALGPYDENVLDSFYRLGRIMANSTDNITELVNSTRPISIEETKMFYQFMCGAPAGNSNDTLFGIEADQATRFDSLRDNLKDMDKDMQYIPDPTIDPVCNTIFMRLESQRLTAFIWKQLKPFIRGEIYYAPKNEFTDDVMQRVEAKFGRLNDAKNTVDIFIPVVHRVRAWLRNHSSEVDRLKEVFSDPAAVDNLLKVLQVNLTSEQREQLQNALNVIIATDLDKSLEKVDLVLEVMSELMNCTKYENKTVGFETENEAVAAALPELPMNNIWAVVIFPSNISSNDPPSHLRYKIRMDSDKVDSTRSVRDRLTTKHPRRRPFFDLKYITHGFVYLQEFIEHSVIEKYTGISMDSNSLFLQQTPYPCHIFDQFVRAISRTFPMFMVLSWVYASSMIIKSIVFEKEKHLREVMKVMGLGNIVIWVGWFIDSFVVLSLSATVLSVILKWGKVIELADFTLILVFMLSFTVSVICFSFLVSTFFNRANSAAAAGGIIFFIMYLPYNFFLLWEEQLLWYHIMAGCLLSNVAFGFGCNYFARLEEDGVGAQWDRISLSNRPDDDFNLSYCILMLWFDSILYILLTLYIEAIAPGSSGTPKKWYFLFQKSTYCKEVPKQAMFEVTSPLNTGDTYVEAEPEESTCGVRVVDLCKKYANGKVALENLNINFYENQITSFLGHNGAGKTTTISILTGLFPPSRGTAYVYNNDIRTEMASIRKDLGICPQYNVLFDRLTVREHIIFFSGLKGKEKVASEEEIDKMLLDLGIPHKRNEFPRNLSGGMKRKLSVAIAFVGGSKTVFLDEPTSGVDPFSRRSIWELLLKYKEGRTIILTTHFMDEADLLGDRVAIISQGRLKTCGSSLFLKTKFGQGYSLHIVRNEIRPQKNANGQLANNNEDKMSVGGRSHMSGHQSKQSQETASDTMSTRSKNATVSILNFVKNRIPSAVLVDDVGSEVHILLPYSTVHDFPALLNDIDSNLETLGVSSYGLSDTTLEDVFLRITTEDMEHPETVSSFGRRRKLLKKYLCPCCIKTNKEVNKVDFSKINGGTHGGSNEALHNGEIRSTKNGLHPETANGSSQSIVQIGDNSPSLNGAEPNAALLVVENGSSQSNISSSLHAREFSYRKRTGMALTFTQIGAILQKRFRNSKRNLKAMFFEIILPALFIALTLAFTLILPKPSDEAPLVVSPFVYPSPNYIYFKDNTTISNETVRNGTTDVQQLDGNVVVGQNYVTKLIDQLTGPIGLGTVCLPDSLRYKVCNPKNWSNASVAMFSEKRYKFTERDAQLRSCNCNSGSQMCQEPVETRPPPMLKTQTDDFILDVSKFNLPEWVVKTHQKYTTHRYGGFQFYVKDPYPVNLTYFVVLLDALTALNDDERPDTRRFDNITNGMKVWYDNKGWVSSIAYLNGLNNMIFREAAAESKNNGTAAGKNGFGITLIQHPLNLTDSQSNKESLKVSALGVVHAICVIFALSFVPASFTVYLIEERSCGGKHLHLVSGVKPFTYWISNFVFDMMKYLIPAVLCLLLFIAFDAKAYISDKSIGAFSVLLLLYGWASIPLMYPASYVFGIPSTAFVVLACGNLFIGVITTVSTFVLEQFGDKELEEIGDYLKQVFLIFPQYCLGRGLIELVRLDILHTAQDTFQLAHREPNRFEWKYLGKMHFFLLCQGLILFLFNLLIDYKQVFLVLFRKKSIYSEVKIENEDEDVTAERARIASHADENSTLFAENLTKYYSGKRLPSVNRLCFAMDKGECFGLLGVNGAGKTSTFKMLTGDVGISYGRARICSFDVDVNRDQARKHFGYCPQEDGVDPLLNGFEQLELYGKLRGLSVADTKAAGEKLVKTLGLTRYAKRRCGTYSGGNRRKLSTAVALIGDPDIVFLDEPTSGMDPGARRQLWKVILELIHVGKSVVLTSHSMEECEALCTRLGIMVNGNFVCLGSIQHLKNRFGRGYMLTIKCEPSKEAEFVELMQERLHYAKLEDSHCSQLKFSVPQDKAHLSQIFQVMDFAKGSNIIEDYSVSQTTLDDIFVKFASHQKDELDRFDKVRHGKCWNC